MEKQEEQLTIQVGTEADRQEANAHAVGITLEALATMIEEVHKGFGDNHKLLVKARPFNKGSLEIPLELVLVAVAGAGLFDSGLISRIIDIIKGYFSIKNDLKGEIPRIENGKVIFQNNTIKADNITVNLLDPSSPANQLMSKAVSALGADETVKDVVILRGSKREEIARIPKQSFPYYKTIETKVDIPEDQVRREKAVLIIRSVVFEEDSEVKWKFFREGGIKISANIVDEAFLTRVKAGEKFAAGDSLNVDLQTKMKYDQMYGTYTNPKYTIMRVHKHEKGPEQLEMDYD